jgi:hypothetical protein
MRILSAEFCTYWRDRLINTHPALLPSFKGAHAHRDVLAARVRITGCTVHYVTVRTLIDFKILASLFSRPKWTVVRSSINVRVASNWTIPSTNCRSG